MWCFCVWNRAGTHCGFRTGTYACPTDIDVPVYGTVQEHIVGPAQEPTHCPLRADGPVYGAVQEPIVGSTGTYTFLDKIDVPVYGTVQEPIVGSTGTYTFPW